MLCLVPRAALLLFLFRSHIFQSFLSYSKTLPTASACLGLLLMSFKLIPETTLRSSEDSEVASLDSGKKSSSSEDLQLEPSSRSGSGLGYDPSPDARTPSPVGGERDLLIDTIVRAGRGLPHLDDSEQAEAAKEKPITWRSLPRKDQLLVLTLSRLSEPLTQTSLGSYIFHQLKSFDPSLPDSTISAQAGMVSAAFPAAQFFTAMLWGKVADSEWGGRKKVIYIGLLGTMCSIIGFGFSRSFMSAVFFRGLAGILNGNIGVMRTMVSEIIKEKKYQSRAFIILPMTFNIGVIIGPVLGICTTSPAFHIRG